jgi:hypothetical protein
MPISAKRSPKGTDLAPIGTIWTCEITNCAWILASISSNEAHWIPITVNAGARVLTGDVIVLNGSVCATTLCATGDTATSDPGKTILTNVFDTTKATGFLRIKSHTHKSGENAGLFKMIIDSNTVWVPFFDDPAPT